MGRAITPPGNVTSYERLVMTDDMYAQQAPVPDWSFFLPWEEDEILATYIIPQVEAATRAPRWLWNEGRCYFGLES